MTDFTVIILCFFFLLQGASRGLLRSLMTPFSVVITSIISYYYYQGSKDMVISLIIVIIGPLLLNILLKFLLKKWIQATNNNIKPEPLSCLAGALLTFIWGWTFIIFTLILLSILPPWGNTMTFIHNEVANSMTYNFIAKPLEERFLAPSMQNAPDTSNNLYIPSTAAGTNNTVNADAWSLANDPRFQKILEDPEIKKDVDAHDIAKLMNNPKMMALVGKIMNDPATMKKVINLYSSQPTDGQETQTGPNSVNASQNKRI